MNQKPTYEELEQRTKELEKMNFDRVISNSPRMISFLDSMVKAQSQFIQGRNSRQVFDGLLSAILEYTDSAYGYIGEVYYEDGGASYQLSRAISNLAWDETTGKYYDENWHGGLRFESNDTLLGMVTKTGQVVVANDVASAPRSKGEPAGHPAIHSFLGIPIFLQDRLVGSLGLANRIGGYDATLVESLRPFVSLCAVIISSLKLDIERKKLNEMLEEKEKRYRTVLETISEGIILQSASGEILTWNKGAEDIFGICANNVIGQTTARKNWPTIHEDGSKYEGEDHPSMRTLQTGEPCRNEIMGVYQPSGGLRWININTNPLFMPDSNTPYAVAISFSDITEFKRMENVLKQNEARLKMALEAANAGTWEWDLNTNKCIWSDELYRLYDLDPNITKASYESWLGSICPEDQQAVEAAVKNAGSLGKEINIEWRVNTIDESTRWLMSRGRPQLDSKGQVTKYLGIAIDITERKQAEMNLEESESCYRELFNNIKSGVAIYTVVDDGKNFIFKDFNRAGERLDGDRRDDLVGKSIFEVRPGIERFGLLDIFKRVWKTGTPESFPATVYKDDRLSKWYENFVYRLPSGKIVAVFDDVTERKQVEIKMKAQAETLHKILNSAPNILAIVNDEGRIEKINHKGVAFSGREEQQLIGLLGGEVFNCITSFNGEGCGRNPICSQCPVRTRVESTISTGTPHNDDEGQMTFFIDGTEVTLDILISTSLIEVEGTKKVLLAISDITKIKQSEKEKAALNAKLQTVQRIESIGNLAGGIAHDFNNILFPIVGMSELLLEDLPQDSPEHEKTLVIYNAGKRGSDLVKQILAFSRQSELKKIPIRIQHILKEVMKLSRSTIPVNIDITQDIQSNCSMVQADPTQVHQIAMNLITNAYHAVEPESGEIAVRLREIEIESGKQLDSDLLPGKYALLSVSDTGVGIDPAILQKIFEPYFTTKEQGKGTGLGLAVVYGIVREHQGDIKVYSELGKGSAFNVYLPIMAKAENSAHAEENTAPPVGHERILLVDDEGPIAKLEKQMLERLGYTVIMRVNSSEALEAFKAKPGSFDLVISDMTMPQMTGDQLSRELISIRGDIPIIICTGFSERLNQEKAAAIGVKGFLMKPIAKAEMAKMVRKVLDEAEGRNQQ